MSLTENCSRSTRVRDSPWAAVDYFLSSVKSKYDVDDDDDDDDNSDDV